MRKAPSLLIVCFLIQSTLHAQWDLVGKTTTGSQFEMTHPGQTILSCDSTKLFFFGHLYFATYDIATNTLTNFTRKMENGGEIVVDCERDRIISLWRTFRIYDIHSYELIDEKSLPFDGYPEKMFIDNAREELITVEFGYDGVHSIINVCDINDFTVKERFEVNGTITNYHGVLLDNERSNLYMFYTNPNAFEVYDLIAKELIYFDTIPSYYVSPQPKVDYKNDRILLLDYGWNLDSVMVISLQDQSSEFINVDHPFYEISIDTISNIILDGGNPDIYARNPLTFEILDTIKPPEPYFAHYPFSCPKFNYLYGINGDYLVIFDLQTFEYLGKVKVGASPGRLAVDYLKNIFFTREILNPEFTLFSDYRIDDGPQVINNFEVPNGHWGGFEIVPDEKVIFHVGLGTFNAYRYHDHGFISVPLAEPLEIAVDREGKRVFVGQSRETPGYINRLNVYDYNLDSLWSIPVPWVNADLEYDNKKYIYYHARKTWSYPAHARIFKINSEAKEIVDSLDIGFDIIKIEYSESLDRLYAINIWTDFYQGYIYEIDCKTFECLDSIDVKDLRSAYFLDSLDLLMILEQEGNMLRMRTFDILAGSFVDGQLLPEGINPLDMALNPVTNSLYIVDQTIGGIYKFRNRNLSWPAVPGNPAPPVLEAGDKQIVLRWARNDTVAGYKLYRKKGDLDWVQVSYEPLVDTFYKDLNLVNNIEYTYALSLLGEHYIEGEKSLPASDIPSDLPDFELSSVYADHICSKDGKEAILHIGIQAEGSFTDTITLSITGLPAGITAVPDHSEVFEEKVVEMKFRAGLNVPKGDYLITIMAEGGGQTHTMEFSLQVIEELNVTIERHPEEIHVGEWMTIEGSIYPLINESVVIHILSSGLDPIAMDTVLADAYGVFRSEYIAMTTDTVFLFASVRNLDHRSDTLKVFFGPGNVFISCVTDISKDTEVGWNVEITGKVHPNPGSGSVRLQITSPIDSVWVINNIPLNEFGFYGHTFTPDTSGLWEVVAYYSGNDNYATASSHVNCVPVGISAGYAILFVGDVSDQSADLDSTFRNTGEYIYRILMDKHLGKDDVYMIYPVAEADLDGNSLPDDVDALPSAGSIREALEWAASHINGEPDLNICLVGSVAGDSMLVSGDSYLHADSLDQWIEDFSNKHPGNRINIVVEGSYGMEYLSRLSGTQRRVITSTNDSINYFFNYGDISFSGYFWNYILQGASVGEAFILASSIINSFPDLFFNQLPLLDANGNIVPNEQEDIDLLENVYIGYGTRIDNFAPEILGSAIDTEPGTKGVMRKKANFTKSEVAQNNLYLSVMLDAAADGVETIYALLVSDRNKTVFVKGSGGHLPEYKIYVLSDYQNTGYFLARVDELMDVGNFTFIVYASDDRGLKAEPQFCQFSVVELDSTGVSLEKNFNGTEVTASIFPNPFSHHLTIVCTLQQTSDVTIRLYNASGALIDIMEHRFPGPGTVEFPFHTSSLQGALNRSLLSGFYIITLDIREIISGKTSRITRKLIGAW
ncbi:MAG: T9SS type A sorting domain-containing protein [Bacteroidales bacterium]|nr:T9SS type A sorting domain-containing protein [Bacteroidales bacterium]MBN2698627.1 T9SS type A sorting domain-containing protein [Bacteroidales bacterium]